MHQPAWRHVAIASSALLFAGLVAWVDLGLVEAEMIYQGDATDEEVEAAIRASPLHHAADLYTSALAFPVGRAAKALLSDVERSNAPGLSFLASLWILVGVVLNGILYGYGLVWLWAAVRSGRSRSEEGRRLDAPHP